MSTMQNDVENSPSEGAELSDVAIEIPSSAASSTSSPGSYRSLDNSTSWTDMDSSSEEDSDFGTFNISPNPSNISLARSQSDEEISSKPNPVEIDVVEIRKKYEEYRERNSSSTGNTEEFRTYMENLYLDWEARNAGPGGDPGASILPNRRDKSTSTSSYRPDLNTWDKVDELQDVGLQDDISIGSLSDADTSTSGFSNLDSDYEDVDYPAWGTWVIASIKSFGNFVKLSFMDLCFRRFNFDKLTVR